MARSKITRRRFVRGGLAASAALTTTPYWITGALRAADSKADRHVIGCIGTGDRWKQVIGGAMRFGDVAAVCDVDRKHVEEGREKTGGKAEMFEDYQRILDRKDIDVVTIVTPDHWHAKIAIEAMKAGKDVYCEKPLTLTIDEGKQIAQVLAETKRVFQVGTQQRSEMSGVDESGKRHPHQFLHAVALVQSGRIGKVKRVSCMIGTAPTSGPLKPEPAPAELNWEMWLGQAPKVDYIPRRCHYEFRWWYEYSGGKMTDWGAHHVDIAQWAIGMDQSGPQWVEGTANHPVPLKNGFPTDDHQYNVATNFTVRAMFPGDIEMVIRDGGDLKEPHSNGILFEGEKGTLFVNRGSLQGQCVLDMKDHPLPEDAIKKLYKGKAPGNHMTNFFECVRDRTQPISDVNTHHRAMTTCHLANIAIRLGRKIQWDAAGQKIVGDDDAAAWVRREQRKGYEIVV